MRAGGHFDYTGQMTQAKAADKSLSAAVFRLIAKNAIVREARAIGASFRLITVEGPELRGVDWRPGAKVQIHVGGWAQRTYTPLSWNGAEGSLQLLAYAHGEGPGARRMQTIAVGESCTIFGPRRSIDLSALERPGLIFGDETSIGLAHALRHTARGAAGVSVVLEVSSRAASEAAAAQLELGEVQWFERKPGDAHVAELARHVGELVRTRSIGSVALSGKASSIQAVNKAVRAAGLSSRQIHTKAYWAVGKAGLD